MAIKTINGISIIKGIKENDYSYHNSKNSAYFSISSDDVSYHDSYGNCMVSRSCHLRLNGERFRMTKMREQFNRYDGTIVVMLPKEEIQEIANKTFYADGQFPTIDFLTFTITEHY